MTQKPTYEELEQQVKKLEIEAAERKRIEELLLIEKNFSESIIDSLPGIIYFFDDTGKFLRWNKNFETVSGYSPEEISKMSPVDLFEGEDKITVAERIQEVFIKGESSVEADFVSKNGTKTPYYFTGVQIHIGNKNHVGGMGIDITDRMRSDEEKVRLATVVEQAAESVVISNRPGIIQYVNPSFERLSGFTREEIVGKHFRILKSDKHDESFYKDMWEIISHGNVWIGCITNRMKDGTLREFETIISPIRAVSGEIANFVSVNRDITRETELEAQIKHAQKMEAIGTLAGGVAHDFNNLMMGMLGNISLILHDLEPSHPHHERLKHVEELIQSGSKLTNQLLGFARKGKYEVKPASLNKIVKESSETFGRTRKEITIKHELTKNLFAVEADETQIQQVLFNLYINAADAMPGGGNIFLQTMNVAHAELEDRQYNPKPGNYVMIRVMDQGAGMDEKTMERIFDPFFTTKEMGRGTGLGLASAYGIIKGHGGYIDVDSKKGFGTTFNIYLRASDKKIDEELEVSEQIEEGIETILLVDDEEMVLDVGVRMLEKIGYVVLEAKSGQESIEIYKENKEKIDLVILDMVMPGIGGGEAFDKMKEINSDVRALLSSGYSVDGRAQEILDRGCNGFIQKPFNLKDLSQKIREILNKK